MRSVVTGFWTRAAAWSTAGLLVTAVSASAAQPAQMRLFPAEPALVPIAVAAAFVLPAALAAVWVLVRRLLRSVGPVISVCVGALLAVAVAGYLNPDLLTVLKT